MPTHAPWVVYANYFQFGRGQQIAYPCVRSRMLLWCKSGQGNIRVNESALALETGDVLLTPWRHAMAYEADQREPYFLAGIHLIPHQTAGAPYIPEVAHIPGALQQVEQRRMDTPWRGLEGLQRARFGFDDSLQPLADFIVRRFQQEAPAESLARELGGLLLAEMTRFWGRPHPPHRPVSVEFQRALQYMDNHMTQPVYLHDVARVANHSLSWLHRQFRDTLGTTPAHYIIAARIKRAKHLLATSTLNVGEVGRQVGLDDPYYFSKLFKSQTGTSPRQYRRRALEF